MSLKTKPDSLIIKWQWLDWNMNPTFSMLYPRTLKGQDWIWNLKEVDKRNVITEWKILKHEMALSSKKVYIVYNFFIPAPNL